MPELKKRDKLFIVSSVIIFSSYFVLKKIKFKKNKKINYWEAVLVDPNYL